MCSIHSRENPPGPIRIGPRRSASLKPSRRSPRGCRPSAASAAPSLELDESTSRRVAACERLGHWVALLPQEKEEEEKQKKRVALLLQSAVVGTAETRCFQGICLGKTWVSMRKIPIPFLVEGPHDTLKKVGCRGYPEARSLGSVKMAQKKKTTSCCFL